MGAVMEDLAHILPESVRSRFTGRSLQMILLGTIAGLTLVCIVLACLLGLHATGKMAPAARGGGSQSSALVAAGCESSACLETAARLSENMDSSVDPCTDFHAYACGSWGQRHSIPPNAMDYTVNSKMRDANLEKLRELLEKPLVENTPLSSERKLKQFFRMCLHDYGRMRDTGPALIELISQYFKGWYGLDPDNWMNNGWNLNDAISKIQGDFNVDALLKLTLTYDYRTRKPQIMILRGGTTLYYSYYLRDDKEGVQDAYKDYMRTVAGLLLRDANLTLSGSETQRRVEQFVDDAYGQEKHLAQLQQRARRPPYTSRYARLTLKDLEGNFTQLPWRQMLQESFASVEFHDNMNVKIWPYGYFHLVDELLRNESTNGRDRIMNNYLVWNFVSEYSTFLSWEYKFARYRYNEIAFGRREFPQAWKECLLMTQSRMGSLLAGEFLKKHADSQKKSDIENMYDVIQTALYENIEQLHWMDNQTKARAEEKVASINRTIGFPNSYFNQTFLDQLHSRLIVNRTDGFLKTFLNVQRFQRYMRGLELQQGSLYYMWNYALRGGVVGTSPAYFWRPNYMLLPPGAMQSPYYVKTNPSFANFAGIGTQIARSVSKSINDQGRRVWTNGSIVNWWTDDTYSGYLKAKKCFSNYFEGIQVGPYLIKGQNETVVLRGEMQSRRVMELITGLRTALNAYRRSIDNGVEAMPVGLHMTLDQAFFTSAAQTQCFIRTPRGSYNLARYQYMPENALWNGALSHMKEFAKAFKCPAHTPMATNETCFVY